MMVSTTKMMKMTIAIANRTLAIFDVAADTPEKPKNPATIEITRKIKAHFSIVEFPLTVQGSRRNR